MRTHQPPRNRSRNLSPSAPQMMGAVPIPLGYTWPPKAFHKTHWGRPIPALPPFPLPAMFVISGKPSPTGCPAPRP